MESLAWETQPADGMREWQLYCTVMEWWNGSCTVLYWTVLHDGMMKWQPSSFGQETSRVPSGHTNLKSMTSVIAYAMPWNHSFQCFRWVSWKEWYRTLFNVSLAYGCPIIPLYSPNSNSPKSASLHKLQCCEIPENLPQDQRKCFIGSNLICCHSMSCLPYLCDPPAVTPPSLDCGWYRQTTGSSPKVKIKTFRLD